MAWKDSLQDASFRGVRFDVIRTRDNADRDTASHEYPYLDGADIEDLGRKARGIHLTAIVWGDDYEHRLRELLKVLDEPGHGELVHPVFGSIAQAQLLGYAIEHDADSPDYCTLELSFAEATPGNPFFDHELPEQQAKAVEQLADTARSGGIDAFASALDSLKGMKNSLSRLNALRSVMTGTLWAIKNQVGGIISTTLDLIDYPRAFASDLTGLIGSMADLRGFDTAVLKADWKSLASDMDGIVKLPARTASGAVTSGSSGGSGGSGGAGQPVMTAKPVPAPAEDVALVTTLVQLVTATELAATAADILAAEAQEPTLSPPDIEQMTNDVREVIQSSIEAHRAQFGIETARPVTEALKDVALAIQTAAMAVMDARPPLVQRTVDAPGNLHLLAFRWYGDYGRAAELARLNPLLVNPNLLKTGDVLNAYAR
ncbi:DNA circularization N-terminal domain-containing protein [Laribacter hongkongensis]|uniref:DNA circularization protein n=1 Tax=Laribacter hongkongensis TaxID=168471 RepID=UPI001EFE9C99|nr:DNA circularization N-terminal domain-containing protein [Laribacter hongkongensis]MCG8996712.1 DNA circularization N-terminal domain-containing protein [Laribacter hongkongensis]MCG9011938.1 DNA circularization N-terminal domain-containing protein [Laribacter hongkongensis]MCG9048449.1 DNA circularization N-terminal domain-containing protein [Laribacter hongkongensis]MCG9075415.1 DNA circularization N-terminal domain-containing protein [Laribacter hongkongensis]